MTVHHDKLAYGKLASMREDCSENDLIQMLQRLPQEQEKSESSDNPRELGKQNAKDASR